MRITVISTQVLMENSKNVIQFLIPSTAWPPLYLCMVGIACAIFLPKIEEGYEEKFFANLMCLMFVWRRGKSLMAVLHWVSSEVQPTLLNMQNSFFSSTWKKVFLSSYSEDIKTDEERINYFHWNNGSIVCRMVMMSFINLLLWFRFSLRTTKNSCLWLKKFYFLRL